MSTPTPSLQAGQAALAGGDWTGAREAFEALLAVAEQAEALEGLGWALWWLDRVAMTATIEPTRHKVQIPGVLDLDIEALTGWDGESPVVLKNGPAAGPGVGDILIAHSNTYHFTGNGLDWDYRGRSASMRKLDLKGAIENVPADPPAESAKIDDGAAHHHHH
jgi:hypothetical protein